HGGDFIGANKRALEKIDIAVKLQEARREIAAVELEPAPVRPRENSLKAEVVNREDGPGAGELGIARRLRLEKYQGERGLPVVAMDNRRGLAPQQLQRGAAEEAEALGIVRVISGRRAVEKLAVEIRIAAEQINRDALGERAFQDRHRDALAGEIDGQGLRLLAQAEFAAQGLAVGGRDDADFVAEPLQGERERAEHVRQAAGLGEGRDFGSDHRDLHGRARNEVTERWSEGAGEIKAITPILPDSIPPRPLSFAMGQEYHRQGRQRERQGKRPAVLRRRLRLCAAGIAQAAAAVKFRVAVQRFAPETAARRADAI